MTSIHWATNDHLLITASADRSALIWNLNWTKRGEKLLILDHTLRPKVSNTAAGNESGLSSSSSRKNEPFSEGIRQAQFYYDDKLIALASGPRLYFY